MEMCSKQAFTEGETGYTARRSRRNAQVRLQVRAGYSSTSTSLNCRGPSELPTYDLVIPALLEFGIDKLRKKCNLTPGVPLKPMLAKPTKAIGEVLDRFENKKFTCEYKYDGERAQVRSVTQCEDVNLTVCRNKVHKLEDGTVGVFSRNSEDMSKKYPDLMDQLPHVSSHTLRSRTSPRA